MSCGKPFHEATGTGSGHGISRSDAVAGGGGGLPRRDAGGYLRCINPGCSRRPRVKADAACKQCGSKLHCTGEEDQKVEEDVEKTQRHNRLQFVQQLQKTGVDKFPHLDTLLTHHPSSVTEIDLSDNQITTIPSNIEEFVNLKKLNLSNNPIRELPPEIGSLVNLEELYITNAQLKMLPSEIAKLKQLRIVEIGGNQIDQFPIEITNLPLIQELGMANNNIKTLPPEIGRMHELVELRLRNNRLVSLTGELTQLKKLEHVDVANNSIRGLPQGFDKMNNLGSADFSGNPRIGWVDFQWAGLRSENNEQTDISPTLMFDERKTRYDLSGKNLDEFPDFILSGRVASINDINLSDNEITSITPEIARMKNLEWLRIMGNPIPSIPQEIKYIETLEWVEIDQLHLQKQCEEDGIPYHWNGNTYPPTAENPLVNEDDAELFLKRSFGNEQSWMIHPDFIDEGYLKTVLSHAKLVDKSPDGAEDDLEKWEIGDLSIILGSDHSKGGFVFNHDKGVYVEKDLEWLFDTIPFPQENI